MSATGEFRREQRRVALSMAGALVVSITTLSLAAMANRTGAAPFVARLHFAVRADLAVVAWLAAAIANVARLRFFSEQDIAGSTAATGSAEVRVAGAILQNTFEQANLAIVTHLVVAASFQQSDRLVTALVSLFALGRLAFWIGYSQGAGGRAFGFALTFYPSVLALLASAAAILSG